MPKRILKKDVKYLLDKGNGLEESEELKIVYRDCFGYADENTFLIIQRKEDLTYWGFVQYCFPDDTDCIRTRGKAEKVTALYFKKSFDCTRNLVKLSDIEGLENQNGKVTH